MKLGEDVDGVRGAGYTGGCTAAMDDLHQFELNNKPGGLMTTTATITGSGIPLLVPDWAGPVLNDVTA